MTDLIKGSIWPWEKTDLIARLLAEETDLTDCAADHIERTEAKLTKAVEWFKKLDRRGDALETFDLVVHEIVTAALAELVAT